VNRWLNLAAMVLRILAQVLDQLSQDGESEPALNRLREELANVCRDG